MLNAVVRLLVVTTLITGCAHHGAVRVECDGPISAINSPVRLKEAPVSIVPASPGTQTQGGTKAP
jgi:hypothetical protein